MADEVKFTDLELFYSATARCRCGSGLAHPLDHELAFKQRAWNCAAYMRGESAPGDHDSFDFAYFKIREETSINNSGGHTTRPPGTVCRTVGKATCPKCQYKWQSEPYVACGLGHHWFSGPCPSCGYAVYSSKDGEPIETRFSDVVLSTEGGPTQ